MSEYIQFFDAGAEPRHELLGGKCASLVAMTAAGMPVPPGFAVTTRLYDAFVAHTGLAERIAAAMAGVDPDRVSLVDAVAARIRAEICSAELPEPLRARIVAAYRRLQDRFDREVRVAVRSSATAEDLPDASFAGQQDTYLSVLGADAVVDHVRRCWASLYTCRAILYRLRNGVPDRGLSMAVAVQKMVDARVSGVAITMNPTNGDRSKITIDACYGVGELVVSGQVTPDNIVVDKVMLSVVSQTIGAKHAELVPAAGGGGLIERAVDPRRRTRRCLSDTELTAVAALAKRAEKHFRCPQDVEWAIDADLPDGGNLLLLQSRPETVHSAKAGKPPTRTAGASAGISLSGITDALVRAAK